jgi:glutathione peroxidase-family protein
LRKHLWREVSDVHQNPGHRRWRSALFKQLTAQTGQKPRWNFHKYLIGRDGKVVDQYSSMTGPESKTLLSAIDKALKAKP